MRLRRWLVTDVHAALAIALGVPVLVGEAVHGFEGSSSAVVLTLSYVGLQAILAVTVGGSIRSLRSLARFLLAVGFVAALTFSETRTQPTLPVLYVPIIILAAAASARSGLLIAIASAAASRLTTVVLFGATEALDQSILPVVVVGFLALGTRQIVASLERSLERVRHVAAKDRRKARRLRALEALGRALAIDGPSPGALAALMDVLARTFGYHYASVYLWDGRVLSLGAQRGYDQPILEFDTELGIIGRVARTREPIFAPDVTREADYKEADSDVVSEIGVPLLAEGELLGVLNVESTAAKPLDGDDLAAMLTIADRLSAAIALGRERTKLAERAALLGRLTAAFGVLGATLEPESLYGAVAESATTVVACDFSLLTLADPVTAEYQVVAGVGVEGFVGAAVLPGEGATGQAIASRAPVLDDRFDRSKFPKVAQRALDEPAVAIMAIPMIRDDAVLGAITLVRREPDRGFTDQEREVAALLAAQAALAVANARLHADTREAALRDALTGLHNRRMLDATLSRMTAVRQRQPATTRHPVSAILFDLDNFGDFNKRHGHLAGDAVLRGFAGILSARFRASDVVARYGGEEFLVVLEGAARNDAVRAADEVRERFARLEIPLPSGEWVHATVSAGCAGLDADMSALEAMIEVADVGLAMAKAGGKNQVVAA